MNGKIFDIQRGSLVDGDGVRTTIFLKGCNLKCKWCHNPEGISKETQLIIYKDKCKNCGICKEVCPNALTECSRCGRCQDFCSNGARELCGKEYTVDEVVNIVLKDRAYYEKSGGGATFSGGECMLQIDFLANALRKLKEKGIDTAVDTAGNVPWEYFEKILPFVDTFLYDIKCVYEPLHIEGTGVSSKTAVTNLIKLVRNFYGKIRVRVPVIEGFNATDTEMERISGLLKGLGIFDVELLPYHNMGKHKYEGLDMEFTEYGTPSPEKMERYRNLFKGE